MVRVRKSINNEFKDKIMDLIVEQEEEQIMNQVKIRLRDAIQDRTENLIEARIWIKI